MQGLVEALQALQNALKLAPELLEPVGEIVTAFSPTESEDSAWVQQAQALRRWEQLSEELVAKSPRGIVAGKDCREALIGRCQENIELIEGRKKGTWLASMMFSPVREDGELFDELKGLLQECQKALEEVDRPAAEDGSGLDWVQIVACRKAVERCLRGLRQTRPVWVPAALRMLEKQSGLDLEAVEKAVESGVGGHWPEQDRARVALVCRAITCMPESVYASKGWLETRETLMDILGMAVEFVDRPEGTKDPNWQIEDAGEEGVEGMRRPALLVKWPGQKTVCVAKGRWAKPADAAYVSARLRAVARSLKLGDGELATLCEKVAKVWPRRGTSIAEWWKSVSLDVRQDVWELMQRLHLATLEEPEKQGPIFLLYEALNKEGLHLRPATAEMPIDAEEHDWFVYTAKGDRGPSTVLGPVLEGPDGRSIAPGRWLRLQATEESRPFVRCLKEVGMRVRRPPFDSDPKFRELFSLEAWDVQNGPKGDGERCLDLFRKAYRKLRDCPVERRQAYVDVVARVYRCLREELKVPVSPSLDGHTLEISVEELGDSVKLKAVSDPTGRAGEMWIEEFSSGEQPAVVAVRVGAEVARWLALPEPPEGSLGKPLRQWRDKVWDVMRKGMDYQEAHQTTAQRFRVQLDGDKGPKWFHELAKAACGTGENAQNVRVWLEALCEAKFVKGCYPEPTAEGPIWPEGVATPNLLLDFSPRPVGAVDKVDRFAETPEQAQCTFSLGPEQDWALYHHLKELHQLLKNCPVALAALSSLIDQLKRDRFTCQKSIVKGRPLFSHLLEKLNEELDRPSQSAPLLPHLTALAAELEGDFWPRTLDDLEHDFPGGVRYDYNDKRPPGEPIRFRFRLLYDGTTVRAGELVRSAGPAPDGYQELRQVLNAGPAATVSELKSILESPPMPPDDAKTWVSRAVEEFYRRGGAKDTLAKADEAAVCLERLIRAVGLEPFSPEIGRECAANWLAEDDQGQLAIGESLRVQRVRRPGLRDDNHLLLAPAVIVSKGGY